MIELLVTLVISMLIALAAIAALTVARRGFSTVDAASQLRDNGRFSSDLIQRVAVQSGFKDIFYATQGPTLAEVGDNMAPNITGFNNGKISSSNPFTKTTRPNGEDGYGSDVLILRYQSVKLNSDPKSTLSDKSMINCMGTPSGAAPTFRGERTSSIFHITISQGEPSLMCTALSPTTGNFYTQPIIRGVENFQVLYGVDGFTAVNTLFTGTQDSVPDKYLRADQIVVAGDADSPDTNSNWRRVRSLRIGMVLRGPLNSASEKIAQTLYPFGLSKSSSSSTTGSALSSSDDPGSVFSAPADRRLRQVVTFTVHLRNDQGL